MQGGPGASSSAMESAMVEIHTRLSGSVNVYTMDHRGTGRSTLLDCVAAQVTTTGSPFGSSIEVSEVPACAQALEKKYGNLSSFSMTTAATDMATFIANHTNGVDTIVYGVSYGTALVERLIHLNPPKVIGYVLDGVATSSGSSQEYEYFSTWDVDFGSVGDGFLKLCDTLSECSTKFEPNLASTLQSVISQFDQEPEATCAALVRDIYRDSDEPASYTVRRTLGVLLEEADLRTFIPPIVYRLDRCASNDIDILKHFFTTLRYYLTWSSEDDAFESTLLYYLIVFSEMWERPQPAMSKMTARFTNTLVSDGGTYSDVPQYCAFSKEKSPVCNQLNVGTYNANGIIYERDKYWNKSAKIPAKASVLLLSSKLDPQTPHKYAEYLLQAMSGRKELVTFNHATHGTLWTTPMDDSGESETCGMKLLLSYVSNNGKLDKLDKSCVDQMPAFSLTPLLMYQYFFLSTEDTYDGEYDASLAELVTFNFTASGTAKSKANKPFKTAFIVFLVLFIVTLAIASFFTYRWYQLRKENVQNRVTDDLPDDFDVSTLPDTEASTEQRDPSDVEKTC
ncbi:putative peptidase S33 tripeptidyl aminopeptidase-like, alpha/Beta hydrolase [Plasmopara halstedii]